MSTQFFPAAAYGGDGGELFDDVKKTITDPIAAIQSLAIEWDAWINKISITYLLRSGATTTVRHGGPGGTQTKSVTFGPEETIIGIAGWAGAYLNILSVTTQQPDPKNPDGPYIQTTYGPWGGAGGSAFLLWGNVLGFYGRSKAYVDRLGCYVSSPVTGLYGGGGSAAFADPEPALDPPIIGIKKMVISADVYVDAIATTYLRSDGTTVEYAHGGTGGDQNTINFSSGETILAVLGRSKEHLDQIAILTIDQAGHRKTYGPYGGPGGDPFIVNAPVEGFFGQADRYIDALGFYAAYPPTANITVFGAGGYLYTILESRAGTNTSNIPVPSNASDLSFLVRTEDDSAGVSITVTDPNGTIYSSGSDGQDGIYAVSSGPGIKSFYTYHPMPGNWVATVTAPNEMVWSVIASISSPGVASIAAQAFGQLSPSERRAIHQGIALRDTDIPAEVCYLCQAQMMALMAIAWVTFEFWAGPVTASSVVVLYAQRLFPSWGASIVATINNAYTKYTLGGTVFSIARYICEAEGMCAKD